MTDRQQADRYTQTDRHFLLPEKVYVSDFYQKVGVDNRLKKAVLGVDARDLFCKPVFRLRAASQCSQTFAEGKRHQGTVSLLACIELSPLRAGMHEQY